ncbi:hypothetical protein LTR53_006661 [Teratosphaeriaceae sp. CCFEE 6253]|nr:hypothetical protein LTR53_006661 [Teratosphaeriaceae sp. CCFEE 6253]
MQGNMWLKKVLIPFWAVELLWLLATLVVSGLGLYAWETTKSGDSDVRLHKIVSLSAILLLAMAAISILFDLAAIVLFARHTLQPLTFVIFSSIKAVFWIFIFVVDIIDVTRGNTSGIVWAFLFSAVLFCTSVGQVAYAAVILHRTRKGAYTRGDYGDVAGGINTDYRGADHKRAAKEGLGYAGAPPNPFRDPSREPSPAAAQRVPLTAAQEPRAGHPAFRGSGENESYYDREPAHASFEMTTAYRDDQA